VLGCGEGSGFGRAEDEGAGSARLLLPCAAAALAALAPLELALPADERAASIAFTVQLRAVSNPMPTVKTTTRRRQYVAGEIRAGRLRTPRGESALPPGSWPISLKYARRPGI